jgi:hypothetical protein
MIFLKQSRIDLVITPWMFPRILDSAPITAFHRLAFVSAVSFFYLTLKMPASFSNLPFQDVDTTGTSFYPSDHTTLHMSKAYLGSSNLTLPRLPTEMPGNLANLSNSASA